MPETIVQATQGFADVLKWVFAFVVGLLGFNIRQTARKVDDHDRNHISRDEFNDTVGAMRKENREDFKDMHRKIDKLLDK